MKFSLYNTETRGLEPIYPLDGKTVKMYTCGPTIYDFAHIGNFRTYVFEDLLRRSIRFFGFPIEQAMNITDLDDKTIRGAIRKGISLKEFTDPFRRAFFEDLKTLQIEPVEHYPAATDYIPQMIALIEQLLEKGIAYRSDNGSVYFSLRKFPSYGRLSHFRLEELQENASGENDADEYDKEHLADFALWKHYDQERDGAIFWESPFGPGRPGWHIECSAMAMALLGPSLDLHCGGVDNLFPHHENEIAQSEGCSGCKFVRHWVHVEHLLVDHRKMSKSLGNFYTLRDLTQKGYTGREVRYLLLSVHYRTQLNFTLSGLDAARASLQRIDDLLFRLRGAQGEGEGIETLLQESDGAFRKALAEDLNISSALAALFDLIRELNTLLDRGKLGRRGAEKALELFAKWDEVLAIFALDAGEEKIPVELEALLEKRERARREKQWALSDQLRDEITEKGYRIEDTPQGARLKRR